MAVGVGDVVFADLGQVEIDVLAMLVPQRAPTGEKRREVGVAVAVALGHAASPEDLRGIE